VHQQISMFVYVQVSLLVYAYVSINLCLIVIKTVFDYHSPSLCDIVLEVLIILSLISIYDLPFQKHYFIISFYSHFVNHFLWHNFYTWLHLFICPCFLVLTFVCNWFGLLFAHYTTSFTQHHLQLWMGEKNVGHSIFYFEMMLMLHIWTWTITILGRFDIIFHIL